MSAQRLAGSAAATAVLQLASMGLGALLAVLIVNQFGQDAETDGVLAAYGVYNLVVVVAQTFRATTVPRMTEPGRLHERLDEYLGASLVLFAAAAIPLVVAGSVTASALTADLGPDAREAARSALLWLWLAAGGQLVAALGAAALATRGEFALPGAAYVLGGLVAVAVLGFGAGPIGIDAIAVGVAAGSFVTCAVMLARLATAGYRPVARRLRPSRAAVLALTAMLGGAVAHMIGQLNYVITLAFAATLGAGAVTLFSYAFFGVMLLSGITSAPAALVLAAPIARDWDRRTASLRPHLLAVLRTGLVLLAPAIALAAAIGDELAEVVLGAAIDAADADTIVATFLALSPNAVTILIAAVPTAAAFAAGRFRIVGLAAVVGAAAHAPLVALAAGTGELALLGAATAAGSALWIVTLVRLVYGRAEAPGELAATGLELLRIALAAAPTLVAGVAAGVLVGGVAAQAAGWLAGAAAFALVLRALLPEHWALVERVLAPLAALRRPRADDPLGTAHP